MNTAPLIDRLRTKCTGFKFIGGAMDLGESTLQAVNFPAAFVVPLVESAGPNQMLGTHDQQVSQTWGVVICIKNIRTTALDQSAALHTLRASVRDALTGWTPTPDTEAPFDFASGQLLDAEGGSLLWQDDYTRATHYRNPNP
jgi:hypothetical protein